MSNQLAEAAQAVIERWDCPLWDWEMEGPTADLIHALRQALAAHEAAKPEQDEPLRADAARWRMQLQIDSDLNAPPEARKQAAAASAYSVRLMGGYDRTAAIDAAMKETK